MKPVLIDARGVRMMASEGSLRIHPELREDGDSSPDIAGPDCRRQWSRRGRRRANGSINPELAKPVLSDGKNDGKRETHRKVFSMEQRLANAVDD